MSGGSCRAVWKSYYSARKYFFEICARCRGGQKMHCRTRVEYAIDGGGGIFDGVGATIISAVKVINSGGVIN